MNPLRSPRFQSDAERCSIAAISCDGFPNGIFGAEHPIVIDMGTTYHAPRTFFSLTWPRERLVETLPRVSQRAGLAAAFLLGGLFLFLRRLFLSFWPRLFGGVLFFLLGFLLGLRLGRGTRLFHREGWCRRRTRRRREHRLHEPRSGPTTLRYIHLLKHRIFSYAVEVRGRRGWPIAYRGIRTSQVTRATAFWVSPVAVRCDKLA